MSGERPEERWNPTQTPETILLSVISMLSDPNFSSPANVDASVEWRKDKKKFLDRCKKLAEKANTTLPLGFTMPEPFVYKPEPQTPQGLDEDFEFEIDEDDMEDLDDEDLEGLTEEEIAALAEED